MPKYDFNRTNVDVNSLNVSAPNRSSFDLSKNSMQSIPFGILYPTRCTKIIPGSTIKGSVNPDLQLEKFATPAAGRMRLDTHTFIVPSRRINKDFKQFIESGITGQTAQNLPSFTISSLYTRIIETFYVGSKRTLGDLKMKTILNDLLTADTTLASVYNPSIIFQHFLDYCSKNLLWLSTSTGTTAKMIGTNLDFFKVESERLNNLYLTAQTQTEYYLGDLVYDLCSMLFGEGSTLDQLGYPIISYYGSIRERLNKIDKEARSLYSGTWTLADRTAYMNSFDIVTLGNLLNLEEFDTSDNKFVSGDVSAFYFATSEMPLRANYSVWFDYFRNWHLDPESKCLNPDDFGSTSLIGNGTVIQLLIPRKRNWSRDGFTMVQPDDVYRHVYAPAPYTDSIAYTSLTDQEMSFLSTFEKVKGGFNGQIDLPFPSSLTNLFTGIVEDQSVLYHDLQTMRRAEMLRHKLTRDYYNPDTYVGQHFARYGVEPEDMSILCSKYLGGNETMINGSQQIANIGTEETTVGQRTLVANASSKDEYIYNTSEHAYLINFVSIVPLVHYDALDMTLQDISVHDQVIPEFANDNQVMIRTCDMVRDFFESGKDQGLGYVPRYYGYRIALDDVHGKYLREYRSYTWLRDHTNDGDAMLTKNSINEHINVPLDCFLGLKPWDTVAFGPIDMPLFVECALPAKLENV